MPEVTVLMAVYNGERYLQPAIDSVLRQTHRDFEFLIVDDGSSDRTPEIVAAYRDSRVRFVALPSNVGLSHALNHGMRLAQAPFIARQDADDLSEPYRLERQLTTMRARPDIALLGSQALAISSDGTAIGTVRRPATAASLRWFSIFDNPFIHSAVMFRADVVRGLGGFDAAYDPFSQDYDLWCRLMDRHAAANLADPLVRYRVNDTSIIGALGSGGSGGDYQGRFDRIVRELTARQARRVLGAAAIDDRDAPLVAGLALGLPRASLPHFLSLFERLLTAFCARGDDCRSPAFRWTLARQFDALACRVHPLTRRSTLAVYAHAIRRHPSLTASVSWPRALSTLLFGSTGRDRLAVLKRQLAAALLPRRAWI